jgi:muconolactone D-isomerase
MAEYLVHMQIRTPPDMPADVHDQLYADEAAYCLSDQVRSKLRRLWRVPCTTDNWGLWEAATPTELHEAIAAFPLFRYMTVEVVALADNHNDPGGARTWYSAGAAERAARSRAVCPSWLTIIGHLHPAQMAGS